MIYLQNLRTALYRVRKRVIHRKPAVILHPGYPDGLTEGTLQQVCSEHFGSTIKKVEHLHLSGWKSAGAYRLIIRLQNGKEVFIIFKDAVYDFAQIPALENLPARPGPPEFTIYRHANEIIAPFLPKVYCAEELVPGTHYRYLLEDLGPNYHVVKRAGDIEKAIATLPRLYKSLNRWGSEVEPQNLLHYNKSFLETLYAYSKTNLDLYSQYNEYEVLVEVLKHWPEIMTLHQQVLNGEQYPKSIIHGDLNYTNIHQANRNGNDFKLVDWEWAGIGYPHADLVSLLKGQPEPLEVDLFRKYTRQEDDLSYQEHRRLYIYCMLERGLLDAGFLTGQAIRSQEESRFSFPNAIRKALEGILSSYRLLADG
jgi:hypothetical protein